MKIACYVSDTKRDKRLFEALAKGFRKHGDTVELVSKTPALIECGVVAADLAVYVGVRTSSLRVHVAAKRQGQRTLMLDKGYFTRGSYHRFSLDYPQPSYLHRMSYDRERLTSFGITHVKQHRNIVARDVVYVESTQKYYTFHGMGDVKLYSSRVCKQLVSAVSKSRRDLRVVYRPRAAAFGTIGPTPSGTYLADPSSQSFASLLPFAYCVVIHGSNAGVEAMLAGVPVLSIGSCEVNPIHDIANQGMVNVLSLITPDEEVVMHRMAQLAWCQFDRQETASGLAWEHVRRWL